jgi:hypothetical protein
MISSDHRAPSEEFGKRKKWPRSGQDYQPFNSPAGLVRSQLLDCEYGRQGKIRTCEGIASRFTVILWKRCNFLHFVQNVKSAFNPWLQQDQLIGCRRQIRGPEEYFGAEYNRSHPAPRNSALPPDPSGGHIEAGAPPRHDGGLAQAIRPGNA